MCRLWCEKKRGGLSASPFLIRIMSYSIKKGFENQKVGAKIFDGTKVFNGTLESATQEELEELHSMGIKNVVRSTKKKRKNKKRDNAPSDPLPVPPENE